MTRPSRLDMLGTTDNMFAMTFPALQAPCQHNFCLGCFNKWVNQGKKTCPTCRHPFPAKFASNPRINTALAGAIRMAKLGVVQPAANRAFEVTSLMQP